MEEFLEIMGAYPLVGSVQIHAAKNAVLPMMAAAMLTDAAVTLNDCPHISDIESMSGILTTLGLDVVRQDRSVTVSGSPSRTDVPEYLACAMRSSVYMLGALLSELGEVRLYTPGGCRIGARPVDIHLDGLSRMGAEVEFGEDYVLCHAESLHGTEIVLKYPSVGATENLLLAAVKAKGESILIGCAREPEITSLVNLLNLMGARISGAGTPVLHVCGVDQLCGVEFTPVPDRIVAGTVLSALSVCGGKLRMENCCLAHVGAMLSPMLNQHFSVVDDGGGVNAECDGRVLPCDFKTGPYPLFPTDLQAPVTAALTYADGISLMTETVFENRFSHVNELNKMGAAITLENETAVIHGGRKMRATELYASDLRGGAGLVVAALGAEGVSRVKGVHYIDRGYESIESMFSSLGAKIVRKNYFNPQNTTY